jgi:hypothetical protein
MLMRKEVTYVLLGSALPALGNFVAVVIALRCIDSAWLGRSYALIALYFVSIDLFNFGSARVYCVDRIRERFSSLLFLDMVSALGSTIVFAAGTLVFARYGVVARPQLWVMLLVAPIGYAMSHFSLGFFRLNGGNGLVCLVSSISALSRVAVVWLVIDGTGWTPYLPDLLLLVETLYGLMLLSGYLALNARMRPNTLGASSTLLPRRSDYVDLMRIARREVLSSWYSNALFSGSKQADVMLVSLLVGPSGAALYRGVKGVHNLAFNFGQSLALTIHARLKPLFEKYRGRNTALTIAGIVIAIPVLLTIGAWVAYEIRLFPTKSLGPPVAQVFFLFSVFLGACLMFLCRLISLYIFSLNRRSFMVFSTLEAFGTIALLTLLAIQFGIVGATLGIVFGCGGVLFFSLVAAWRAVPTLNPQ